MKKENKNNKEGLILTLYGNSNYGNKLQNYAVQQVLSKYSVNSKTLVPSIKLSKKSIMNCTKGIIKKFIPKYRIISQNELLRKNSFLRFDKMINKIKEKDVNLGDIDYIFIGSDQVWNSNDLLSHQIVEYVNRVDASKCIIGFSGSVGNSEIRREAIEKYKNHFNRLDYISVRENVGKQLIEKLTNRKDIIEMIDPTLLLKQEEWEKLLKKPQQMEGIIKNGKRFILNYFLGQSYKEREDYISKVAKNYDCEIINILDKKSPFYTCGPSEFLWLEKNAFLICTDSFHACVFSLLFNRPFIVFKRFNKNKSNDMNSRITNFLEKFQLLDRYYDKIDDCNLLSIDYGNSKNILNGERKKADSFIRSVIKDN